MKNSWLFKYRYEFPLFICVLTTIDYTFDKNVFLLFNPNYALLWATLIALFGFAFQFLFGKVSAKDDFQFNKTSIVKHTRFIGDYFYWLACAVFSGSFVVILTYSLVYILVYGVLIKRETKESEIKVTEKLAFKRGVNNFILVTIAFLYISTLKEFILTKTLFPSSWAISVFSVALSLFVFSFVLANRRKRLNKKN